MVPFDTESPFITSGIRIGTPAITTRGLNEKDCEKIVFFIDKILTNVDNPAKVNEVKDEVNKFMSCFPMFKF
jgi:glycine hydroxymethyltransferase